ncbi:hypothetical protein LR48_Vigan01g137000 [Vigna angularis]|uniref:Uncharacterized protein n=1 Tax=Phaseolus angularis TaxID=3914 RepID=A0A0L9TNS1_PHAAN|nr:hypothetical protein LR48_Vigan01g137000 [Vigna angularis]
MTFHQQVHDASQHFKSPWYLLGDQNRAHKEIPWMPLSVASPLPMEKTVVTQRQTLSAPPSPPHCPTHPPRLPQHPRHPRAVRFCLHVVQISIPHMSNSGPRPELPKSAAILIQDTLQHRPQALIEGARESWSYAIFRQFSCYYSGSTPTAPSDPVSHHPPNRLVQPPRHPPRPGIRSFGLKGIRHLASTARPSMATSTPAFGHSASLTISHSASLTFGSLALTVRPFALTGDRPLGLNPSASIVRLSVASSVQHSASLTFGHSASTAFGLTDVRPLILYRSAILALIVRPFALIDARPSVASSAPTFGHSTPLILGHSASTVRPFSLTNVRPLSLNPSASIVRLFAASLKRSCIRPLSLTDVRPFGLNRSTIHGHERSNIRPFGPTNARPFGLSLNLDRTASTPSASRPQPLRPQSFGFSVASSVQYSASLTFGHLASTVRPSVASSVQAFCLIVVRPLDLNPFGLNRSAFRGLERPAFCIIGARPSVASSVPAFCLIDVRSLALGHAWHVRPLALGHAWSHMFKHSTVRPFATSSFPTFGRSASHVFGPSTSTARSSWALGVQTFSHLASTLGYTWPHVFKRSTVRPFAASSFPTFGHSASHVGPLTSTARSSLASGTSPFVGESRRAVRAEGARTTTMEEKIAPQTFRSNKDTPDNIYTETKSS